MERIVHSVREGSCHRGAAAIVEPGVSETLIALRGAATMAIEPSRRMLRGNLFCEVTMYSV